MNLLIWGAYQQQNFGDDLMAVMFYQKLTALGHRVSVFGLSENEARLNNIVVCHNLEDGLKGADAIIIGGGAVLNERQFFRRLLRSSLRKIELRYLLLSNALRKYKKPLYFSSIGSDGIMSFHDIPFARRKLLFSTSVRGGTVRLKRDVDILAAASIRASAAPDILLGASDHFKQPRSDWQFDNPRILLNLHKRHREFGERFISLVRKNFPEAHIFVGQSCVADASYPYEWECSSDNVTILPYDNCVDLLKFLSTMNLVLSSKLHVGLVAMSFGVPFLSIGGRSKVREQLSELDLEDLCYIFPDKDVVESVGDLKQRVFIIKKQISEIIPDLVKGADEHINVLQDFFDND